MKNSTCSHCHSNKLQHVEVIHHFLCAYVGPAYDFKPSPQGRACPKCARCIDLDVESWDIAGHCLLCNACGYEMALPT